MKMITALNDYGDDYDDNYSSDELNKLLNVSVPFDQIGRSCTGQ